MAKSKEDLDAKIRNAFAEVPYPGDDNIGDPRGRDEKDLAEEWFSGKDWRELGVEDVWRDGLYWMTPKACHYFLPAFLLHSFGPASGELLDGVLFRLAFPEDDDVEYNWTRFREFLALMTHEQKQAVREFLLFAQENQLPAKKVRPGSQAEKIRTVIKQWDSV